MLSDRCWVDRDAACLEFEKSKCCQAGVKALVRPLCESSTSACSQIVVTNRRHIFALLELLDGPRHIVLYASKLMHTCHPSLSVAFWRLSGVHRYKMRCSEQTQTLLQRHPMYITISYALTTPSLLTFRFSRHQSASSNRPALPAFATSDFANHRPAP
jgi:hypothetical protein